MQNEGLQTKIGGHEKLNIVEWESCWNPRGETRKRSFDTLYYSHIYFIIVYHDIA